MGESHLCWFCHDTLQDKGCKCFKTNTRTLYINARTRPAANDFNMHREASKLSVQRMPDMERRTKLRKIFCSQISHKQKSQSQRMTEMHGFHSKAREGTQTAHRHKPHSDTEQQNKHQQDAEADLNSLRESTNVLSKKPT